MKQIVLLFIVLLVLYLLRVPSIVIFVDGLLPYWNQLIDTITNLRERHPFIFVSLYFVLFYLMRPDD